MDDATDPLAELVNRRKHELGLPWRALAERSAGGASASSLHAIANGRRGRTGIGDATLRGIALALDLPLDEVQAAADARPRNKMQQSLTPQQRRLRAQLAAHTLHAQVEDPSKHTRPAREAFFAKFEKQVDTEGVLPQHERQRRAQHARAAWMKTLALKATQARQAKRAR